MDRVVQGEAEKVSFLHLTAKDLVLQADVMGI